MMLRFLYKVTRPVQIASVFLATWITASLSGAPSEWRQYAAWVMGLSCLGSSLFHYGAAHKMYARKLWDIVEVRRPWMLVASGLAAFTTAVVIADWMLPPGCVAITWFNAVAIGFYSQSLSRQWFSKNIIIAVVCTTPVLMGWWVGSVTHPAMVYLIVTVFCGYYAREIIKDVQDIKANVGIRVTLPMVIGITGAQRIAGVMVLISAVSTQFLLHYSWGVVLTASILFWASLELLFNKGTGRTHQAITMAMFLLIVTFGL